jgi:hypothetical protein
MFSFKRAFYCKAAFARQALRKKMVTAGPTAPPLFRFFG